MRWLSKFFRRREKPSPESMVPWKVKEASHAVATAVMKSEQHIRAASRKAEIVDQWIAELRRDYGMRES